MLLPLFFSLSLALYSPSISDVDVENGLSQFLVSPDESMVFAVSNVARSQTDNSLIGGSLYVSLDDGRSFKKQEMPDPPPYDTSSRIISVLVSPVDPTHFYTLDAYDGALRAFLTHGGSVADAIALGNSYSRAMDGVIALLFHPTDGKKALSLVASDGCFSLEGPDCAPHLYVTKDSGATWDMIQGYVADVQWVPTASAPDRILAVTHVEKEGDFADKLGSDLVLVSSDDMFETPSQQIAHGVQSLVVLGDYVVGAREYDGVIKLLVGQWGEDITETNFRVAEVPGSHLEGSRRFTFLDVSETTGAVMLAVEHEDDNFGTLFMSDSTGTNYVEVLRGVNRVGPHRYEVFLASQDLGIIMANKGIAPGLQQFQGTGGDTAPYETSPLHRLQSLISFDFGAEWHNMSINDANVTRVHLVLSGGDAYLPLATPRAPGFYFANGLALGGVNAATGQAIGVSIVSTDYGRTWQLFNATNDSFDDHTTSRVQRGWHSYDVGHYGSIVLTCEYDDADTVLSSYTWDSLLDPAADAAAITNLRIPVVAPVISSVDQSAPGVFFIVGVDTDDTLIYRVDYTDAGMPECAGRDDPASGTSDYEVFVPHDTEDSCILGRRFQLTRRRTSSPCFDGGPDGDDESIFAQLATAEPCECTHADFECNFDFVQDLSGDRPVCVPSGSSAGAPLLCAAPDTYTANAYRKVPASGCVGGIDLTVDSATTLTCPSVAKCECADSPNGVCLPSGLCQCAPEFYGIDCSRTAVDCSEDLTCTNGRCVSHDYCLCDAGFSGVTCEEDARARGDTIGLTGGDEGLTPGAIVGVVFIVLFVVVLVMVGAVCWMRRERQALVDKYERHYDVPDDGTDPDLAPDDGATQEMNTLQLEDESEDADTGEETDDAEPAAEEEEEAEPRRKKRSSKAANRRSSAVVD
jgi:hypothetical protein